MHDPCPTCSEKSAWGCPTHAPKHMEAVKRADAVKMATLQMYAALLAWRKADDIHTACEDCMESGRSAEACGECFPSADDARLQIWAAIEAYEKAIKEAADAE